VNYSKKKYVCASVVVGCGFPFYGSAEKRNGRDVGQDAVKITAAVRKKSVWTLGVAAVLVENWYNLDVST